MDWTITGFITMTDWLMTDEKRAETPHQFRKDDRSCRLFEPQATILGNLIVCLC